MSTLEISLPSRLTNRNFLLLWQGQVISQLGNQAFALATAFWLMEATGSASLMGLLLASTSLPTVLLAPLGGAVADRLSRIRILIVCDLAAGAALGTMALAMLSGRFASSTLVAMLFGVGLLTGVMNAFFQPAFAAIIPDLVPADRLVAANSMYMFSFQVLQLVGQGVGGVLYRLLGAARLFLFDGISFLFAAGSEALVRIPPPPPRARQGFGASAREFLASMREGLRYIRSTPGLMPFLVAPTAYNACATSLLVLLPFFVRLNLHAGPEWYGFLLAAISLGSILGYLLAGLVRVTGEKRARLLVPLIASAPAPMALTGFVHNGPLALVLALAMGIMLGLINVNLVTLLQTTTPDELRGRVLGLWSSLTSAVMPLGMALGGVAGDLTGKNIPLVFTTAGALTLLVTAITLGRRSTRRFLARG
jgi:DHA3 family macrolide efflux protein-like MFS transporter